MRLTKKLKEDILKEAMKKSGYDNKVLSAKKDIIHEVIRTFKQKWKDNHIHLLKLPEDYLGTANCLQLKGCKYFRKSAYREEYYTDLIVLSRYGIPPIARVPACFNKWPKPCIKLEESPKLKKLDKEIRALMAEREKFHDDLYAVLYSVTTDKKLIEIWPGVTEFASFTSPQSRNTALVRVKAMLGEGNE